MEAHEPAVVSEQEEFALRASSPPLKWGSTEVTLCSAALTANQRVFACSSDSALRSPLGQFVFPSVICSYQVTELVRFPLQVISPSCLPRGRCTA